MLRLTRSVSFTAYILSFSLSFSLSFFSLFFFFFFFFNDTATTEIYTLSLHDALPIWAFRYSSVFPAIISTRCVASPNAWPRPCAPTPICAMCKWTGASPPKPSIWISIRRAPRPWVLASRAWRNYYRLRSRVVSSPPTGSVIKIGRASCRERV